MIAGFEQALEAGEEHRHAVAMDSVQFDSGTHGSVVDVVHDRATDMPENEPENRFKHPLHGRRHEARIAQCLATLTASASATDGARNPQRKIVQPAPRADLRGRSADADRRRLRAIVKIEGFAGV